MKFNITFKNNAHIVRAKNIAHWQIIKQVTWNLLDKKDLGLQLLQWGTAILLIRKVQP